MSNYSECAYHSKMYIYYYTQTVCRATHILLPSAECVAVYCNELIYIIEFPVCVCGPGPSMLMRGQSLGMIMRGQPLGMLMRGQSLGMLMRGQSLRPEA